LSHKLPAMDNKRTSHAWIGMFADIFNKF